jgi:hypothetical protein
MTKAEAKIQILAAALSFAELWANHEEIGSIDTQKLKLE